MACLQQHADRLQQLLQLLQPQPQLAGEWGEFQPQPSPAPTSGSGNSIGTGPSASNGLGSGAGGSRPLQEPNPAELESLACQLLPLLGLPRAVPGAPAAPPPRYAAAATRQQRNFAEIASSFTLRQHPGAVQQQRRAEHSVATCQVAACPVCAYERRLVRMHGAQQQQERQPPPLPLPSVLPMELAQPEQQQQLEQQQQHQQHQQLWEREAQEQQREQQQREQQQREQQRLEQQQREQQQREQWEQQQHNSGGAGEDWWQLPAAAAPLL
jgi:hypothetical protein